MEKSAVATEIGMIKTLIGEAVVTASDGSQRTLQAGARVFQNEIITTGATGAVEIEFSDGSLMALGRSSQTILDLDAFDPHLVAQSPSDVDSEVGALEQALLEGADPNQIGEATSAGAGAGVGGNEGTEFVQVLYETPEVAPESGFETTGISVESDDEREEQFFNDVATADTITVETITPGTTTAGTTTAGTTTAGTATALLDDVPTITASQPTEISFELTVTNHDEVSSAGYHSSYGYYIKDADGNPTTGHIIWDDVHDADAVSEIITITGYTPDQIGFFIIPNGDKNNSGLTDDTPVTFQFDRGQWEAVVGGPQLIGSGSHVLFDDGSLNKDGQDHMVDNSLTGNQNWEDLQMPTGDGDFNDVNVNAKWTALSHLIVDETALNDSDSTSTSVDLSGQFVIDAGADGFDSVEGLVYKLTTTDESSGLVDTASGDDVLLRVTGLGVVEGYVGDGVVFTLSVDENGVTTLTQLRAVVHDDPTDHDETLTPATLKDGSVTLSAIVTDSDGDTASDSIDIAALIAFEDDGPLGSDFDVSLTQAISPSIIDFTDFIDVGADETKADQIIRITDGPDNGLLVDAKGENVEYSETYAVNELSFDADDVEFQSITLGARNGSATLTSWGVTSGASTGSVLMNGITATIVFTDNDNNLSPLKVYSSGAKHIGGGTLADKDGNGINAGETLAVSFDQLMQYAEIGVDGLGNHFLPNSAQQAHATWIAYRNGEEVARGEIDNPEGQASVEGLLEEFTISVSEGFDSIEFGNNSKNSGSNYELRYIEAEAKVVDSFDYDVIDGDGDTASATVDVEVTPGGIATQNIDFFIADADQNREDVFTFTKESIDTDRVEGDIIENFDTTEDVLNLSDLLSDGSHSIEGVDNGSGDIQLNIKDGANNIVQEIELVGVAMSDTALQDLLATDTINDGI